MHSQRSTGSHSEVPDANAESPGSKAILISGGARGIGRGMARYFLEKGHRVFILDIDEDELKYTTDVHLKKFAGRVSSSICDLRDVQDTRDKVKKAANFFGGKIDVLVNNGGIASPYWKDDNNMEDETILEQWKAYVDTNLTGTFAVSQACIPYMKDLEHGNAAQGVNRSKSAGPCIIHIGSFRAHQSDPNQEGYATTKAGLIGLMHSMAVSCKRWGIRVNLVAPGRIKASNECKEGDEKGIQWEDLIEGRDVDDHATNRPGSAEDVAQAVEYFMTAGFVTGQDITVDGKFWKPVLSRIT